jgi:protein arginine N-methyltransferase 1
MINDPSRTPLFEKAILNRLQSSPDGSQSQVVLDLGTGPYAYFAIIAAKYGAGKVYAIEANKEAAALARNAVHKAGYDDKITILEGFSTDITLPDGIKADFAIAEIVGSVASEEGAIATISDAHTRLLKYPTDASSWIPNRIQTYAAPASYSLHNLFKPPAFDWTKLNGEPVRFNCRDEGLQLLSDPELVEDISFPDILVLGKKGKEQRRIAFTVDGKRIDENIKKFNEEYTRGRVPDAETLAIEAANSVSGVALWPRLLLDGDIQINSRHYPDGAHQRSHWQSVLPIMSPEPVAVKGGDEIIVNFDFDVSSEVTTPPSYKISGNVVSK